MCKRNLNQKIQDAVRIKTQKFNCADDWFWYCVELELKLYRQNVSIAGERISSGKALASMNKSII
jgi:hypothetical protein